MGRKGADPRKINKIKQVLKENPEGLWIREIARRAGLDKSTVSIYVSKYMSSMVDIYSVRGGLVKIVRVKI